MSRFSLALAKQAALFIATICLATPANAGSPSDFFSHNTNSSPPPALQASPAMKQQASAPKIGAGPTAMMSDTSRSVVQWFEKYDQAVANAKPTPSEEVILVRPMNQELERVQTMTRTCATLAKRYRNLANNLRKMPVQADWPEVKNLRDGEADFYEQEASVYEEMIRPRPPSKTQEEFQARCKDLTDRATATKDYGQSLISMDLELRHEYGVHLARDKDPLAQYVMGTQKQGNFVFPK